MKLMMLGDVRLGDVGQVLVRFGKVEYVNGRMLDVVFIVGEVDQAGRIHMRLSEVR